MRVCMPCVPLDDNADDCDELLAALVQRARHYKTEAEKLHEKERAAATASGAAAVAAHATASMPHPSIAWAAAPWRWVRLQSCVDTT